MNHMFPETHIIHVKDVHVFFFLTPYLATYGDMTRFEYPPIHLSYANIAKNRFYEPRFSPSVHVKPTFCNTSYVFYILLSTNGNIMNHIPFPAHTKYAREGYVLQNIDRVNHTRLRADTVCARTSRNSFQIIAGTL